MLGFDAVKLILRISVAGLMLFHGVNKVIHGIGPIVDLVVKAGLPPWFAYGVYFGEIAGPVLLLTGPWVRAGAALILVNLAFCIALSHPDAFFRLTPLGGYALELDLLYMIPAAVILATGGGRYALRLAGTRTA